MVLVVGAAQDIHNLLGPLTTAGVGVNIELAVPSLIILIRLSSSKLNAAEGAALDVRLYLQYPLDELRIRSTQSDTPTRHIVRLRHGVKLNAAVLGTRYLQDTQMFFAEDKAVGVIVYHNNVVVLSELHQTFISSALSTTTCRHIGIVGPKDFEL